MSTGYQYVIRAIVDATYKNLYAKLSITKQFELFHFRILDLCRKSSYEYYNVQIHYINNDTSYLFMNPSFEHRSVT